MQSNARGTITAAEHMPLAGKYAVKRVVGVLMDVELFVLRSLPVFSESSSFSTMEPALLTSLSSLVVTLFLLPSYHIIKVFLQMLHRAHYTHIRSLLSSQTPVEHLYIFLPFVYSIFSRGSTDSCLLFHRDYHCCCSCSSIYF